MLLFSTSNTIVTLVSYTCKSFIESTPVCNIAFSFVFLGIAFPTCISVNQCVCHFSPLLSEPDITLHDGDLVKM